MHSRFTVKYATRQQEHDHVPVKIVTRCRDCDVKTVQVKTLHRRLRTAWERIKIRHPEPLPSVPAIRLIRLIRSISVSPDGWLQVPEVRYSRYVPNGKQ